MDLTTQRPLPAAFGLHDRHVVVTGGGRGIGRAIALCAAASGARVTLVARSQEQLDDAAAEIRAAGGTCAGVAHDLTDTESLDALAERLWEVAPVDGVVHAAGVQLRGPAVDVEVAGWRRVQALNVDAPYFLSTALARRQLAAEQRGSHVFIGSLNSSLGLPDVSPYVASKTALVGVTRALSTEWAARGLRANIVGPGYFRTEMTEGLLAEPAHAQRILGRIPAGHLGAPEDVGTAAVFLLSDASSYITGQLINVDGGWLAS
ncbi:SDR family NAD(P)-dependent oxidoreductase [Pimelobacter simplex]|uniref:SDR family oxidoreductase n=1 Tax=Nocardioides simplex TaxID=2045 RepID=A0A7J5DSD6_NOCSI|nr:SDR family oxidoreductase [Pimelobacter simplex]KAB2807771.1 SDR family oxidoreductase [Pimelobacter simplex]